MSLYYDSGISSSGLSNTSISAGSYKENHTLITLHLACATPITLSSVTAILSWNDGLSTKAVSKTLLLTSLNNYTMELIPVMQAINQDIYLQINHLGLGSYRLVVFGLDMG